MTGTEMVGRRGAAWLRSRRVPSAVGLSGLLAAVSALSGVPARASAQWLDETTMCALGAEAPMSSLGDAPTERAWISVAPDASLLACIPTAASYHGSTEPSAAAADGGALALARRAFEALGEHERAGRTQEALVSLATLRETMPELTDRWDLVEGTLLAGERRGCEAFERAIASPFSAIAARARVGRVRCLIALRDRRASDELRALLARYPELPEALELRLLEAGALEARRDYARAIAIYRDVDLMAPETREAARARERLDALASAGHRVRPLTTLQLLERADRLVRSGALDLARDEIARLGEMRLPAAQRAEVTLMAARIARVEGRFEDASRLMREARGIAPEVGDDPAAVAEQAADLDAAARAREEAEARHELRRWSSGGRHLRAVSTTRLFAYLRVATRAGLRPEVDAALDELVARSNGIGPRVRPILPCRLRLEAAVLASGSGDDQRVARLLEGCVDQPGSLGTAARYHRARALERAGIAREAIVELDRVIAQDQSDTRWYALWARQRRDLLARSMPTASPAMAQLDVDGADARKIGELEGVRLVSTEPDAVRPPAPSPDDASEPDFGATDEDGDERAFDAPAPSWQPLPDDEIDRRLAAVASAHGEGYPWIARALALFRLGDRQGATDELHEAMLAWNQARGRGTLRAGIEAVYRGATPPRVPVPSAEIARLRRRLDASARGDLADVAASLGDHGLAIRFGGPERAAMRPRAYETIVREVARERGLDPNLLLAVMRVESVYSPRIVSYAGAIGLLQIMPRTGRLIARSMGREDFGIDDLLDPRTNIEMAAWYLSSLIRRFDGRVPLAIAAYNGGPHNVRRWMRDHSKDMPIDAFCERIPFEQTHRYVRRVLSHWIAYRAQEGLPMPELDLTLPELEADRVAF